MTNSQPRDPRGVPTGGRWATPARAEAGLGLAPEQEVDAPVASPWAVEYEQVTWEAQPDQTISRRQRRAASSPYAAAVPPAIAALSVDLEPEVEAEAAEAALAITRFDEEVSHSLRLDPDAEVSPLDAVLLRTESASSSQIEQITANARSLALASIGESSGPNARLVASNARAMRAAVDMADAMSVEAVIETHRELLHETEPDIVGRFRDEPVWIGGRGSSPHTADFVPPRAERVPALMSDLVEFTRRTDVQPLTQAAIAHAQFETIHPFPDGNGRVGRVLVHAMLRDAGVTRRMTVPVSSGLLADVDGYYAALTHYRDGDANAIVERFSDAAFRSVDNGRLLVSDLSTAHRRWTETISARRDAAVWKALPVVISQPAVTIRYLAERMSITTTAAERAINQMADAGVLVQTSQQRRNRCWSSPEVTDALDAFAARAGRRVVRGR